MLIHSTRPRIRHVIVSFACANTRPYNDDHVCLAPLLVRVQMLWKDEALGRYKFLCVGLLLLSNLVQPKTDLVTSRSIYIHYIEFLRKAHEMVEGNTTLSSERGQRSEQTEAFPQISQNATY